MALPPIDPEDLDARAVRLIYEKTRDWTPDRKAALAAYTAAQHTRARIRDRCSHPAELAKYVDPSYVITPAIELISRSLERVIREPQRNLLVTMPPQEGKSQLCAVWAPLRALQINPNSRVILATYGDALAEEHSSAARDIIKAHGTGAVDSLTGEVVEDKLGLALRPDRSAVGRWRIKGGLGGMTAVGLGSSITGRSADCISGDTYIISDRGKITAQDAYNNPPNYLLGYDHESRSTRWCHLEASQRIGSRGVIEVRTAAGRAIRCTPDHRFYTGRGYIAAGNLRPGDALLSSMGGTGMPLVPNRVSEGPSGDTEGNTQRDKPLLQPGLLVGEDVSRPAEKRLHGVLRGDIEVTQTYLLERMLEPPSCREARASCVPSVLGKVQAEDFPNGLLHASVCRRRAFTADDRAWELPLQGRAELCELVPRNAPTNPVAGQQQVCGMPSVPAAAGFQTQRRDRPAVTATDTSHQRESGGQLSGQSDHAVHEVPFDSPQVEHDTVSEVIRDSFRAKCVYDFQVEGTSNFFANEILVHNCLIVDDPYKNMQEADSAAHRRKVWDWWQSVARTRLSPSGSVIIIQTRWHPADLAGSIMLQEEEKPFRERTWRHINIPAVSELGIPDALGRPPGEAMVSARGRTAEQFRQTRSAVGQRTWFALYCGVPAPPDGGLFLREWFDNWRRQDLPPAPVVTVVAVDPAETGEGDKAGIVAGSIYADGGVVLTRDLSARLTSDKWARVVVELALEEGASEVAVETYTAGTTYVRVVYEAYKALRLEREAARVADPGLSSLPLRPPFRVFGWRGKGDAVARSAMLRQAVETGTARVWGHRLSEFERAAVGWQEGQHQPDEVAAGVIVHDRLVTLRGSRASVGSPVRSIAGGRAGNTPWLGRRVG